MSRSVSEPIFPSDASISDHRRVVVEEIQERAGLLADQVLRIWPAPQVPEETLAKYRKTKAKATTWLLARTFPVASPQSPGRSPADFDL